jgi:opacity protein-like surface antigen
MKALLALLLATTAASAADLRLPVKAPVPAGYNYNGSGFYAGIGAVGDVASTNIFGATVYDAGAALDITAGYQWAWAGGANWGAIEGSFQYTNIGATQPCLVAMSCNTSSTIGFEERFLFGFPISLVLSVLPNLGNIFPALPSIPACPVGAVCATTAAHPYIYVGGLERKVDTTLTDALGASFSNTKWIAQPSVGLGIRNQWTAGLVSDTSAGCTFANVGVAFGGFPNTPTQFTRDCRAKVAFYY